MKNLGSRCFIVFYLLAAVSISFAGEFKSKIITTSPVVITVADDHFLKITNFTQEGGVDRGVVAVTLTGENNHPAKASIAFHSSGVSLSFAAAIFSSKWGTEDVPGIGNITGDRSKSQASAT